jgi:tetratricopeptide (TPR) repeat protein
LVDIQPSGKGTPVPPTTKLAQMAGSAPTVRLLTPSTGGKPPLFVIVTPTERGAMERDGCSIWCLEMKSWGKQIDELVEKEEFQEALALLNSIDDVLLEDKEERRSYIEALYAVSLFANGKFDEAIEHFIELETNPARVIALYPEEISGPLAKDRSRWVEMFGGVKKEIKTLSPPKAPKKDDSDTSSITSTRSRKGAASMEGVAIPRDRTMLASLWGRRPQSVIGGEASSPSVSVASTSPAKATLSDVISTGAAAAASIAKNAVSGGANQDGAGSTTSALTPDTRAPPALSTKKFTSEEQRRSIDALGRFLADRRRIFKPILEAQNTSTTAKESQIRRDSEWLLNLPSQPLPSMEIDQLTAVAQTVDTALFKTFLATKPALVGPLCRVENWCEVEQVEELLMKAGKYSELIALYGGKMMHDKALKLLRKFGDEEEDVEEKIRPTIRYLQNLEPEYISLILETAHWVLGVDRKMGMEIFCADAGKVSSLPRFKVVADLESFDEDLCIDYLDFLIKTMGEGDPSLHEKLAFLLMRKAQRQQGQDKDDAIAQFLLLLEFSHQYRAERVLNRLPSDDRNWFEARALLLGRLGQHEAALAIYVNKLKDNSKAEEYCRRIQKLDGSSSVFLILLRIYLKPKGVGEEGTKVELDAALELIGRHGSRIDSVAALELLPPLVSLSAVRSFASKALRQSEARRNEQLLLHQVAKERALQVNENLTRLHSRRVKVTDTRTCPRCMKRLGNSVIAVNPQGAVMHYGCAHFEN